MSIEDAMAKDAIVAKLFAGEFTEEEFTTTLSERMPMLLSLDNGSPVKFMGKSSFDDAPSNSTARIPIRGTMLKYGTYCSYGATEIADSIIAAADHPRIGSIVLDMDSGGGAVDAIAPIVDAIRYARKRKPCVASVDLCASANYYVAIHCDEIIASNNISSEIGSIGVMIAFQDFQEYYKQNGIITHTIYSNLSDWKNRPFELAKEGKYDEIKTEELDPLAVKFQNAVKECRGSKLNQSVDGILQGRMFYAEKALEYGLIDAVGNSDTAVQRARELQVDMSINSYIHNKQ